jgi:hypothetical protein
VWQVVVALGGPETAGAEVVQMAAGGLSAHFSQAEAQDLLEYERATQLCAMRNREIEAGGERSGRAVPVAPLELPAPPPFGDML